MMEPRWGQDWLMLLSVKASMQWPNMTFSLGVCPLVAWSSFPPGNHINLKYGLLSIFCCECYSLYLEAEIFFDWSLREAAPCSQNRRRRHCYITALHSAKRSLSLSLPRICFSFTLPLSVSLFSYFPANSTEICVLLSKYIQSNLITAITFLLGWLTVLPVPLNAAALLLYIPKLLISPHPSCTFTGALAHPSISFLSLFLLELFLLYSPG